MYGIYFLHTQFTTSLAALETACVTYLRPLAAKTPAEHLRRQPEQDYEGPRDEARELRAKHHRPSAIK
ncbi:ABC transporter [Aspergillus luchuensis]|uniref:ABC transporter n=1 Tax=Aspergillus kawachii TaxID=1069201 RepID=A0A146FXR0_ASPKA|nr:ABC transporter [Aspergillus luchuensis]